MLPKKSLFWALTLRHMSITNTTTDKPPPSIHLHCGTALGGRCLGSTTSPDSSAVELILGAEGSSRKDIYSYEAATTTVQPSHCECLCVFFFFASTEMCHMVLFVRNCWLGCPILPITHHSICAAEAYSCDPLPYFWLVELGNIEGNEE